MIFALGPLLAVLAAASAGGLVTAHVAADHEEVARLAGQLGAAGLAPMLVDADRALVAAALDAAPSVPDGWELLDDLARVAGGWDRSQAAPAARAAARIARVVDGDRAILEEIPDDKLASAQRTWGELAMRADRWGDVRVHALEVAARVAAARRATAAGDPGLGYDLAATLADPDPEVRRASCELVPMPAPEGVRDALVRAITVDVDPTVVLSCAQALCAELVDGGAAPVLAALGDDGLRRLRTIFAAPLPPIPDGALIDAARCPAAKRTKADFTALRALEAKAPRRIRRAIHRLGRKR